MSKPFQRAVRGAALPIIFAVVASAQQSPDGTAAVTNDERDKDVVELSPFTVSTDRDYGYRASNSITATRTDTPVRDVPLSIQVFTPELITDLGIKNQVDLEAYSAALVDGGRDRHSDNIIQMSFGGFLFRGFQQDWELRDGIREYDPVDTQNLARVEVVKGPAAALYGMTYPGGVIQNITKTVEFGHPFTALRFTLGNEGDYRAAVDATFSAGAGNSAFGVRVNGVYEKTKDERAHSGGEVDLQAATLAWQPTRSTQAEFLIERGHREKPNSLGYFTRAEFPVAPGGPSINAAYLPLQVVHPEIPWSWNWANAKDVRALETHLYRGTLTQRIRDNFQIRGHWQYSDRRQPDSSGWGPYGREIGLDTGWVIDPATNEEQIRSAYSESSWDNQMHAYGVTGVYQLDFNGVKNTFAFGGNAWTEDAVGGFELETVPPYVSYPVQAGIAIEVPPGRPDELWSVTAYDQDNSNHITFANWQASWWDDRLNTNIGVSRTTINETDNPNTFSPDTTTLELSQNSPLVGAVLDLTKEVSVFALYATSVFPDHALDSWYRHFSPKVGRSIEGGFKFDGANGRISGTVSAYRITQDGGAQWDPNAPNRDPSLIGDNVQGGEQQSTGFEADVVFQPIRNWQFVVSYAHNDSHITESAQAYTIGQSPLGHVDDRFALLTKYTFVEGAAKGLYAGLGLSAGSRALKDYIEWPAGSGEFVARYEPGRTTAEFFGGHRFRFAGQNVMVQLNIKNLTKASDYTGWKATGSRTILATERYRVPTSVVYRLTFGIDL